MCLVFTKRLPLKLFAFPSRGRLGSFEAAVEVPCLCSSKNTSEPGQFAFCTSLHACVMAKSGMCEAT
jgi:hypothetical protein